MFGPLMGATIAIVALSGALALLSLIPTEDLQGASTALAIASLAITALSFAVQKMSSAVDIISKESVGFGKKLANIGTSLLAVIGLVATTALFFVTLGLVLKTVKNVEWKDLAKFIVGLTVVGVLVGAMAALGPQLGILGAGIGPALLGVIAAMVGIGLIVGATVVLAYALAKLVEVTNSGALLTAGLALLVEVGSGLGRFIGAFLAGTVTGGLESVAHSIVAFITAFDGVSFDALDGFGKLAAAILIITATSVLEGVNSLKNLISGQSTMERFASQISDFVLAIQEVSPADAAKASIVMRALRPMVDALGEVATAAKDIPNSGGFLGAFMGDNDINTFGTMLVDFIKAFDDVTPTRATRSSDVSSYETNGGKP